MRLYIEITLFLVHQMDSLFQLRRPYDFLALAQQEQRLVQVEQVKQKLQRNKQEIDNNEDKVSINIIILSYLP